MAFGTVPAIAGHARDGRLRALAITGATRAPLLPDVPSMAQAGFPQVDAALINALIGPAGLPDAIVERLAKAAADTVGAPAMRTRLGEMGFEPVGSTPAATRASFAAEIPRWEEIVRKGGIKPD
jgi:tripartite-type tricarboxylate transporter receptor subunit TctC